MLKQLFKNAFQQKESKFGFNLDFVGGTLNHNPINNFRTGEECALNFENQQMFIKQGDNVLTENMTDIESIRTWTYKRKTFVIHIHTKTYNEYKFSTGFADHKMTQMLIMQVLTKHADAFGIPIEFCGDFKKHGNDKDDE